jgi:hypothetical protein
MIKLIGSFMAIAGLIAIASVETQVSAAEGVGIRIGPGGVGVRIGDGDNRGRRYSWGSGYRYYDGYYHGDCGWLRQRAEVTGDRVWMRRYRQCRNG